MSPDAVRLGVYALLRAPVAEPTLLFFPLLPEDVGKQEATCISGGLISLTLGMLGALSGGVEPGEDCTQALRREGLEERGILLAESQMHNSLPTIYVEQLRKEGPCNFIVHGFVASLTDAQAKSLWGKVPMLAVQTVALDRFLREQQAVLRPSIYLALGLILQNHMLQTL